MVKCGMSKSQGLLSFLRLFFIGLMALLFAQAAEREPAFKGDARGVAGDRRLINAAEVEWLQQQLSEAARTGKKEPSSLDLADRLAVKAAGLNYAVSEEVWPSPEKTAERGWGSCAGKSLWLATELAKAGYRAGIRLGVPAGYKAPAAGHAWVLLRWRDEEWVYETTSTEKRTTQRTAPTKDHEITATIFPPESGGAGVHAKDKPQASPSIPWAAIIEIVPMDGRWVSFAGYLDPVRDSLAREITRNFPIATDAPAKSERLLVVSFTMNNEGEITEVVNESDENDVSPVITRGIMSTIRGHAPFARWPEQAVAAFGRTQEFQVTLRRGKATK
jgi:hypothetical protein